MYLYNFILVCLISDKFERNMFFYFLAITKKKGQKTRALFCKKYTDNIFENEE